MGNRTTDNTLPNNEPRDIERCGSGFVQTCQVKCSDECDELRMGDMAILISVLVFASFLFCFVFEVGSDEYDTLQ